jgi:hypothetical protein
MVNGRTEMISSGSKAAHSYDPLNGHEPASRGARTVLCQHEASGRLRMMFYPTGFPTGQPLRRLGGRGLLTDSSVAWRVAGVPNKPPFCSST